MTEIRTERLTLRPVTARDELLRRNESMADRSGLAPDTWFSLAIDVEGELAGDVSCGIRAGGGIAVIGFALRPGFRGRGYASEAAGALVDHLVASHGIHRIEAGLAPDDVASMRVLEAIGMTFECLARDACCVDGRWEDDLRYAMTAADRAAWVNRVRTPPAAVELVEITPDEADLWGRLATHYSEEEFVAPMPFTWRDALFPEEFEGVPAVPWMRGVVADGERAAFVMLSETHGHSEGQYLWRLLVDRRHQRRGIGRAAIALVVERLRAEGVPRLFTSYEDGLGNPSPFYARLGFVPTGRIVDDETELVLELT